MMIVDGIPIPREVESAGPKAVKAYVAERTAPKPKPKPKTKTKE